MMISRNRLRASSRASRSRTPAEQNKLKDTNRANENGAQSGTLG